MRGYPEDYGSGYSADYNAASASAGGAARVVPPSVVDRAISQGAPLVVSQLVFVDIVNPNNVYALTLESGSFVFRHYQSAALLAPPIWAQQPHFTLGVSVGGGGTNAVMTSTGIDRSSSASVLFDIRNSGIGTMELQEDGVPVLT